ncbi:hypothetical protein TRFO_24647 [Tritrichomonas foetus]|uniref:Uncharacterized protein n=1 Tax=Tritrichomonas foetus TaxID=1144522 RepID=A0A1J4K7R8_9EUKA|nr:hypothetical protein TRFO_24647 [Tritrichomonas foetus]|eukprot:OHT07243.1 hypothetical protein TRFO_24647 [Tritrichomonas foetus]
MEIEDDFIDDSETDETTEEMSESQNNVFLTHTAAQPPREIVLKPAVNIYPLTSLSQSLLSAMYSLIMFGKSDIGATVPGSIFDLGKQLQKMRESFPEFVKDTNLKANSTQYKQLKNLESMKNRKKELQKDNIRLKNLIRSFSKQIPKKAFDDEQEFSEVDKLNAELRSTTTKLKMYIKKLKELSQQNESTNSENKQLTEEIERLKKNFRKHCKGDIGQINKNIVKTEVELQNNIARHKEALLNANHIVESYRTPISVLENRLNDLNRRLMQVVRAPLTDRPYIPMRKRLQQGRF